MKDYGSKKKKRRAEFIKRKSEREQKRVRSEKYYEIMTSKESTPEEMAAVMGILLR